MATTTTAAAPLPSFKIWELPEVLLFHTLSFMAGPTERVTVICHQLAPLCAASKTSLLSNNGEQSPLWSAILKHDYGVKLNERADKRSSKRLKQSPLQRVRDAHKNTRDNAEIAYYYLTELTSTGGLTRQKLTSLIHEYGAQTRINRLTSTGGTFLVECCRARKVKESTILRCVEELVDRWGADVDLGVNESIWGESPLEKPLTALCVAAAKGMPAIVKYLLERGADRRITCTGRFRLYQRPSRSIKCVAKTPLEFAETMHAAELEEGATKSGMKELRKVMALLRSGSKARRMND